MLQLVSSIDDLASKINEFVDCYVSTDASEVEDVLIQLGFQDVTYEIKGRKTLDEVYNDFDLYFGCVINPKTCLEIDCIDVPLDEALKRKNDIDFMPMSKFRVYAKKNQNITGILLPIMKALLEERQNMAFFNDTGYIAYVKLSEFYR